MTSKNETRKALNEITLGALALGAVGLAAAKGASEFYKSGQEKGTGFRYRVGERAKHALRGITPFTDVVNKGILNPWAEDILHRHQEKAHQDLADAFAMKLPEFYKTLQQHSRITSVAHDRDALRAQHTLAQQRKAELTNKLLQFTAEKDKVIENIRQLRQIHGSGSSHPDIQAAQKDLRLIHHNINRHTLGNDHIDELDANHRPTGNRVRNELMHLDPTNTSSKKIDDVLSRTNKDYQDIMKRTVVNPSTGRNYTYGDIISNTGLETLLASNPTAASKFARVKKNILEPIRASQQNIQQQTPANLAKIRADRKQKIDDDLARQKADLASNPPKSVTQPGIGVAERVRRAAHRVLRNNVIDKLRTSM